MARKNAKGSGTIRKKTVTRSGKEYTYWEARITTGRDPGTGKQIQRSFTGKTQKEVREKMQAAAVEINQGTYTAPQRLTVGQWLDVWASDYLGAVKVSTADIYRSNIKNHIKPGLGAVRLVDLHPHTVQGFINGLVGLSPASVRLIYRIPSPRIGKGRGAGLRPPEPRFQVYTAKGGAGGTAASGRSTDRRPAGRSRRHADGAAYPRGALYRAPLV